MEHRLKVKKNYLFVETLKILLNNVFRSNF
jgi:hypothetical protein